MKSFVLLGGGGVFAVHYAKYLLEKAEGVEKVVCVGRNPVAAPPFTFGVGDNDPRYAYRQIHIVFEQDRLFELFDAVKPDVIVNFAALAYATSWVKSHRYYETNVVAVSRMCEELMKRDYLKRFLQIGTSELYGAVNKAVDENYPLTPTSPYAVSKMAADLHLETLWAVRKFPMNILRPSNAYGPGQLLYRILPRAVYCALKGEKLPLEGGGRVKKSYIHSQDLAHAIHLINTKAEFGKIYNAGPELPCTIRHLVELVAEEMDMPFEQLCDIVPGRVGEDAQYWLDSSRIKQDLGWEPKISLREGVRDMIEWGRRYIDQLPDKVPEFVLRA